MGSARAKYAFGFCDRTGARYPLADLVDEYKNGAKTGLKIGRDVVDNDHPQNFVGKLRINDNLSLPFSKPDTALEASRQLFGWNPIWNPAQYAITSVGKVKIVIS